MEANQPELNQPQQQAVAESGEQSQLTKPINPQAQNGKFKKALPVILIIVIVGLGIFTGLILSSLNKNSGLTGTVLSEGEQLSPEIKENLAQTFRDETEGTLEKNDDLDKYAQGTHKLIRPGGEDQTAYLTSSLLDLDEFVGKKIKVYGETFGSSQVGWLMDVGKVEVIE